MCVCEGFYLKMAKKEVQSSNNVLPQNKLKQLRMTRMSKVKNMKPFMRLV